MLVDVIPMDNQVRVVMELPGVTKNEIKIKGSQDQITVSADTLKFNYYEKIKMPCNIDPNSIKTNYVNGVLEITANEAQKTKID